MAVVSLISLATLPVVVLLAGGLAVVAGVAVVVGVALGELPHPAMTRADAATNRKRRRTLGTRRSD